MGGDGWGAFIGSPLQLVGMGGDGWDTFIGSPLQLVGMGGDGWGWVGMGGAPS